MAPIAATPAWTNLMRSFSGRAAQSVCAKVARFTAADASLLDKVARSA